MKKITLKDVVENARQAFVVRGEGPAYFPGKGCMYLSPNGCKCAVGHSIPDGHPAQKYPHRFLQLVLRFPDLWAEDIIELSKKPRALNDIQNRMHDNIIDISNGTAIFTKTPEEINAIYDEILLQYS